MKKVIAIRILAGMLGVVGLGLLVHMRNIFVERGLYADSTGTSGHTSGSELGLLILGLVVLVASIVLFAKTIRRSK